MPAMTAWALLLLTVGGPGSAEPEDFSEAARTAAQVATVRVINPAGKSEGSGVLIKQIGDEVYLLTASHVVENGQRVRVQTFGRPADRFDGVVMARSPRRDVAVVRISCPQRVRGIARLCPPALVPDDKNFPGLTVGCVGDKPPIPRAETVLGKKRIRTRTGIDMDAWEVEHAQEEGRSGGPLFDKRGYVLGIASGTNNGRSYYTQTEEIYQFLKENRLDTLLGDKSDK
jgi:S1-C subfamily serine protease